jgi:ribonuclease Z
MNKIIMLGTGHGFVHELYNTCFIIKNDKKIFLIDTGGSADIVKNLELANIKLSDLHDIFISHSHTDHILGLFWIMKRMTAMYKSGKYIGKLNVYCNDEVSDAIKKINPCLFPDGHVNMINEYLNIIVVEDLEEKEIAGKIYKFIDMKGSKNKLYGFETILDNGKSLVFCGDETLNIDLYDVIKNRDYVMHEAFCLDKEQNIFKPYEKKHSTVMSVSKSFNNLNIKNLILFHTEDTHINDKKKLYEAEARQYFKNNVIVPIDMEEIIFD